MFRDKSTWLVLAGLGALVYLTRQQTGDAVETGVEDVQAALSGWQVVNEGPVWVPVLHSVEAQYGIPRDLLARMAYQETHFRQVYIDGSKASSAGALGIMQLMPEYFGSVRVARPFTAEDSVAQIQEAAQELVRLYRYYQDWGLAVAAYNDGERNVDKYLARTRSLPDETVNYVAQVFADVPVTGATIPT